MYPLKIPARVTAPTIYLRFHGSLTHGGDYELATLKMWGRRIADWQDEKLDVFVYFNNDIEGYAVKDAKMLRGH
jgi:uncharacterized protein YecE (DUF72 family)